MKVVEFFKKVKEKCGAAFGKVRPALAYVGKRKKRFIFGGMGFAIVLFFLGSSVVKSLNKREREKTITYIVNNGKQAVVSWDGIDVYHCLDVNEVDGLFAWLIYNNFEEDFDSGWKKFKNALAKATLNKPVESELKKLETWYNVFLLYSFNHLEQGVYILHFKDDQLFVGLQIKYDKRLLGKYGKSFDAISLNDFRYLEISMK